MSVRVSAPDKSDESVMETKRSLEKIMKTTKYKVYSALKNKLE